MQLSFNVSIVNDNIPEDAEMFNVSLTFDPADQDEPVDIVTVLPDVAMVTILNNDGKLRIDDHEGFGISTWFPPAVITVGYIQTTVTVYEGDGVVQLQLTVATSAAQLDASFSLLVNTSDRTATG